MSASKESIARFHAQTVAGLTTVDDLFAVIDAAVAEEREACAWRVFTNGARACAAGRGGRVDTIKMCGAIREREGAGTRLPRSQLRDPGAHPMNQKTPDPAWQRRFRAFDRLRTPEGQAARDELFGRKW